MASWREVLEIDVTTYKSDGGNQLKGFLENLVRRTGPQYLFDGAQELIVSSNALDANPEHSLTLLVYAGLNPDVIKLGTKFESSLGAKEGSQKYMPDPSTFFQGSNLVLPKNSALDSQFKSFEHWTSVNEVKHISLWLLAALRSMYGRDLPSALEVEIPLPGEARPGRLDVVAKRADKLLCFEAKTSISDAIKERRFVEQVPKYRKQIVQTCNELNLDNIVSSVLLAPGGSESDLKCIDGELKPSPIGRKLLAVCSQYGIKFITANAIWQMLACHLAAENSPSELMSAIEKLEKSPNLLGLTSAGFVSEGSIIEKWVN
jgi:hypothetical protein